MRDREAVLQGHRKRAKSSLVGVGRFDREVIWRLLSSGNSFTKLSLLVQLCVHGLRRETPDKADKTNVGGSVLRPIVSRTFLGVETACMGQLCLQYRKKRGPRME